MTATNADGTYFGSQSCNDWTSNASAGNLLGYSDSATSTWINSGGARNCNIAEHWYCIGL